MFDENWIIVRYTYHNISINQYTLWKCFPPSRRWKEVVSWLASSKLSAGKQRSSRPLWCCKTFRDRPFAAPMDALSALYGVERLGIQWVREYLIVISSKFHILWNKRMLLWSKLFMFFVSLYHNLPFSKLYSYPCWSCPVLKECFLCL